MAEPEAPQPGTRLGARSRSLLGGGKTSALGDSWGVLLASAKAGRSVSMAVGEAQKDSEMRQSEVKFGAALQDASASLGKLCAVCETEANELRGIVSESEYRDAVSTIFGEVKREAVRLVDALVDPHREAVKASLRWQNIKLESQRASASVQLETTKVALREEKEVALVEQARNLEVECEKRVEEATAEASVHVTSLKTELRSATVKAQAASDAAEAMRAEQTSLRAANAELMKEVEAAERREKLRNGPAPLPAEKGTKSATRELESVRAELCDELARAETEAVETQRALEEVRGVGEMSVGGGRGEG